VYLASSGDVPRRTGDVPREMSGPPGRGNEVAALGKMASWLSHG
jgi:hypothetical protein